MRDEQDRGLIAAEHRQSDRDLRVAGLRQVLLGKFRIVVVALEVRIVAGLALEHALRDRLGKTVEGALGDRGHVDRMAEGLADILVLEDVVAVEEEEVLDQDGGGDDA